MVGRVARSPDVTGEVLIRLRWNDFPLQSERGRRQIEFKVSCFLPHHFTGMASAAWHTERGRQIASKSGRTAVGDILRYWGADIAPSGRPSVTGSGRAAEGAITIGIVRFDDQN